MVAATGASTGPTKPARVARRTSEEPQSVPDYCARPRCRREFSRLLGRGRPQTFCSDVCRRHAEREIRQLNSRLVHFEGVLDQIRVDLRAYERDAGTDSYTSASRSDDEADRHRHAAEAVARANGILAFLHDSADPLASELTRLHEAVAPLVAKRNVAT